MIDLRKIGGCRCDRSGPKLVFSCSGCADVGELGDQAARKLSRDGIGKMSCLAGVGGGMSGFIKSAEAAAKVLAIDGCQVHCSKKTLEKAGVISMVHLCLEDIGFIKGQTEVSAENISTVTRQATVLL
jgi:uncharacterized metal-binding protein